MSARKKYILFIALSLLCIGVGAWAVTYGPLWYAKRQAMSTYAGYHNAGLLEVIPVPEVRQLRPATPEGSPRITRVIGQYQFSLPAAHFTLEANGREGFDSPNMLVQRMGGAIMMIDFAGHARSASATNATYTANPGHQDDSYNAFVSSKYDPAIIRYFTQTDPFEILMAVYNARPMGAGDATTLEELNKHFLLILFKTMLMPERANHHWEQFDNGSLRGFIVGDTSDVILNVIVYLPDHRQFFEILLRPKPSSTMDDVYATLAELQIEAIPETQPSGDGATPPSPSPAVR